MRILVVEPSGFLATFQYAHNLAEALAKNGHSVYLATGINFETKSYPRNYTAIEVFDRYIPRPIRLAAFVRFVRRFNPQIVHIQGHSHPTSYLVIAFLLRLLSDPVVVYTAQDVMPKFLKPHHPASLRRLYPSMAHIFVNAAQNKEILLQHFPAVNENDVSVVPLADLTWFVHDAAPARPAYIPADRKVVLFFGNIERRKGLLVLIRALRRLVNLVPDAFLLVAGKPFDDMSVYKQEVARFELEAHVCFKDEYLPLEEIPALFTYSRILALPYTHGWNSGVIATSYTYGKPIIASNLGGFGEVIKPGVTGLLVPPGDDEALADAISRVFTDPALEAKLIAGVENEASNNSWSGIASKSEQVYRKLLAQREGAELPTQA